MKKEPKEIIAAFAAFLRKTGMEEGKVAALFNAEGTELNDNFEAETTTFDANRIQKIKTDSHKEGHTAGFNEGNSKGFKDGATKWEKEAKEKYQITSEKQGLDLVDEIVTTKSNVKPELEADKVKLHPEYIKMENELRKANKDTAAEWEKKYNEREANLTKEKTFSKVLAKAKEIIAKEKFILSKDPAKAEVQLELLVNRLNQFEFTENEGDFIMSKEGKPHEDKHGSKIKFDDFVKGVSESIWDRAAGDSKSSAGNNNNGGTGSEGKNKDVKTPANEAEYMQMISTEKNPERRIAIDEAWEKAQTVES